MSRRDIPFIQDYPFKVNLYGCTGTIYSLRYAGWKLATKQWFDDMRYLYCIQICGEHETTKARLLSEIVTVDKFRTGYMEDMRGFLENVEFRVQTMAGSIRISMSGRMKEPELYDGWNAFTAPYPEMIMIPEVEFNPRRIPFFSNGVPDTELILPEYTVLEMLKKIHEQQEPLQDEIRKERLRQRRKAAQGEIETDNLIEMPRIKQTVQILSI